MSIYKSRTLSKIKDEIKFNREAQKITANNIARAHSPGAEPLKLDRTNFQSFLTLSQPSGGTGFQANHIMLNGFTTSVDKDNRTEAVPGESRISIENESIRMAELDDTHLLMLGLKKGYSKAIDIATRKRG